MEDDQIKPFILVPKNQVKGGERNFWLCVDFRDLNTKVIPMSYSFPWVDWTSLGIQESLESEGFEGGKGKRRTFSNMKNRNYRQRRVPLVITSMSDRQFDKIYIDFVGPLPEISKRRDQK